jgi:CRISPR-associated protein Cmr4
MYTLQRFLFMALDPIHIGAGGYRLGRVDLTIAREPGSNLPKIPGTSLAGAARSYAAMRYEKLRCAGQGNKEQKQCGEATCPICYTFGHIRGAEGGTAGTVSLADAQILLFPVHSMAGPVWVSTAQQLTDAGFTVQAPVLARGEFVTTLPSRNKALNLGWLLLQYHDGALSTTPPPLSQAQTTWESVSKRLVLVEDGLFSQIINSNLEVRTSVSIDPTTGAASDGALFTYEALPRAVWLWSDVVEDDYRSGNNPWPIAHKHQNGHTERKLLGETWSRPLDVVRGGLALAEHLGIGGMGTRGFGRIKVMNHWEVSHA